MCFHFTIYDIQGSWKYNQPLITIGDFTQDELQRRVIGQQCWNNDVTFRNTVATNLQRRVALKLSLRIAPCNISLLTAVGLQILLFEFRVIQYYMIAEA